MPNNTSSQREKPAFIEGNPVVICIDMQEGDGSIPVMDDADDVVPNTVRVLDAARANGVPVIFMQEVHRKDHVDFGRELDGDEDIHLVEGDPNTDIMEELTPQEGDYHIVKRRYSSFFGTDLLILLRGLKADTLILCGGLTNVCVHYTFLDAHQNDYYTRVIEDCCVGSDKPAHDAALIAMEYLQTGARCTHDKVIAALGNRAKAA